MKLINILMTAALIFLGACNTMPPVQTSEAANAIEQAKAPAHVDYVIQPGDILQISVWKEKDLEREVLVRPDGGINFPLIEEMVVSGKTLEEARKELTAKLSKYVPDPVVSIAVKQAQGYKVFVVGKVNRPGEYMANRNMDVMQALSMAGGLTPFASENKIKILRRVNGELKTFPFRYSRVEKGEDLEQNIVLEGGDVVVVP